MTARLPRLAPIAAVAMLSACVAPTLGRYSAPLGSDPALGGGTYTSGGGVTVAADVREKDGKTLVCGVWAQSRWQSALTSGVGLARDKVIGSGTVYLGDEAVARGLTFMHEVPPMADYAAQTAGCELTDRPWQTGDAARPVAVRIPGRTVVVDVDEWGGGVIVDFRPTGPGAGTE